MLVPLQVALIHYSKECSLPGCSSSNCTPTLLSVLPLAQLTHDLASHSPLTSAPRIVAGRSTHFDTREALA